MEDLHVLQSFQLQILSLCLVCMRPNCATLVENLCRNILRFRGIPFMVHLMLFLFKWVVTRIGFCLFLQNITLLAVIYLIFNLVYLSAFTFYLRDPTSNSIILCNVHMLGLKIQSSTSNKISENHCKEFLFNLTTCIQP